MLKIFDRRRGRRLAVREEVTLVVSGKAYPAVVINASEGGLCVEGCGRCVAPHVRVEVRSKGRHARGAKVVWVSDDQIGLAFVQQSSARGSGTLGSADPLRQHRA